MDQPITKIEGPEEGLIEFTSGDNKFKLKKLPTNAGQNGTIKLTVYYEGGSKVGYISYVKINTEGGKVELY